MASPRWRGPWPITASRSLTWDRPNCGASSVVFRGASESEVQAEALGALLRHLDLGPTVIAGGSGGARVSLLAAARNPDVTAGLAMWWISGGVPGTAPARQLLLHAVGRRRVARRDGSGRRARPVAGGAGSAIPANRDALPRDGPPGVPRRDGPLDAGLLPVRRLARPRARRRRRRPPRRPDPRVPQRHVRHVAHPRHVRGARPPGLPGAELVEPPWGDDEWNERRAAVEQTGSLFVRWPLLVPQLVDWADRTIASDVPERSRRMTDHDRAAASATTSPSARASAASPYDDLRDPEPARAAQRALRGARAADLRGRRADPADAGRVQHRVRAAQGPPEPGGAPRRRRRHARRHRDAPRAERGRRGPGRRSRCSRSGCRGTSTTATTTSSTGPACCASVEVPPEGGLTGFVDGIALYDAISPELRDRIEGETVIYAMDVIMDNLRFGRPDGLRRGRAGRRGAVDVMDGVRGPAARAPPRGLDPPLRREGAARVAVDGEGHRGSRGRRRRRAARRRCATRSSRRRRTSATSTGGSRPTWSSGTTGACLHSVSGMAPEHGRCMHRTTIAGDYGLGRFERVGSVDESG